MSTKELQSLRFNLTLGPRPEERTGDPGAAFDPNYSDGSMTPRSSAMHGALDAKGKIDPKKLEAALIAAKKAHDKDPKMDRSKWSKGAGGKYTRVK